ncbi:DUF6907 domain-containing protein [Streptomyces griseoflavus]|uniref:DUF6907 domain-containing protein n=1 Tax=Streptomyces griseoflavus TaxID=35619 RepID=UPI0033CCDB80
MSHSAISQHVAALKGVPSQPTAATVRPSVKPGHRLVPALVGRSTDPGTIVYVECPDWCVVDHVADRNVFLEDISHRGERKSLPLTPSRGDMVPVEVYLSQWPASGDDGGQPYLAVDVDCEVSNYSRAAALALADQLVSFAADVRRLAQTLPDDSPVRSQADEALRRVREGGRS